MIEVYKILEIEPTADYAIIKKAYIKLAREWHPDKNPTEDTMEQFQLIGNAYDLVNNEEKALNYFNCHNNSNWSGFETHPQADPSYSEPTPNPNAWSDVPDGMRAYSSDRIGIFIPIGIDGFALFENPKGLSDFTSVFNRFKMGVNYEKLAEYLSRYMGVQPEQVGVTEKEAIAIVNQHGHRTFSLIVRVEVSVNDLSINRYTEADLLTLGMRSVNRSSNYLVLLQNTKFSAADILSTRPMQWSEYRNTRRVEQPPQLVWDEGMKNLTTHNPQRVVKALPSPGSSNDTFFASKRKPTLGQSQQHEINSVIKKLKDEVNSYWPYFNKGRKSAKINGLETLLALTAEGTPVNEAIATVRKQCPDLAKGFFSHRTADLLDRLSECASNTLTI